jgi:DNA-binding response OmpR family regulator
VCYNSNKLKKSEKKIMSSNISIDLTKDMERFLKSKSKEFNLSIEDTLKEILSQQIDSRLDLGKGFYYDKVVKKVFDKKNNDVGLTKTQMSIFHTLLKNRNTIVDVETIKKNAWKDKNTSIFTLRNMIKQIRDKTFYGLIKSHSSRGYSAGF